MTEAQFKTKYPDCLALAELPWFELTDQNELKLADGLNIKAIDAHTHIGLAWFYKGKIDVWKKTDAALHLFPVKGNPVDLQSYAFRDFTDENKKEMERHLIGACFRDSDRARSHTIPNFIHEMDLMGVTHSVVLAIEMHALFSNTDMVLENCRKEPRLIPFCCIHPGRPRMQARLESFVERGAKGLKFHPVFQMIRPDAPKSLELFRICAKLGLPILTHTNASGEEPKFMQNCSRMEMFREAIKAAEGTPLLLGHSGMLDGCRQAIDYAVEFDHVYLEVSGQPIDHLKIMFDRVDHNKLLYGSDWPFYHTAFQLAKVFIATDGDEALRKKILNENAARLLGLE